MWNATFCDVLHETKQNRKQTLEGAQNGLEIIFNYWLPIILKFI